MSAQLKATLPSPVASSLTKAVVIPTRAHPKSLHRLHPIDQPFHLAFHTAL